jgi:hypothetical protein
MPGVLENAEETIKAGTKALTAAITTSPKEMLIPCRLSPGLNTKTGVATSQVSKKARNRFLGAACLGSGRITPDRMMPASAGPKRASINTGTTITTPLAYSGPNEINNPHEIAKLRMKKETS